MLVLSRQRDETIMIGDDIEVCVVDIRGDKVRLGITAPRDISVHRKEVYEAIRRENRSAAEAKPEDYAGEVRPVAPLDDLEVAVESGAILGRLVTDLLGLIPETEAVLRGELTKVFRSILYTAPEVMSDRWHQAGTAMSLYAVGGDGVDSWQSRAADLWARHVGPIVLVVEPKGGVA